MGGVCSTYGGEEKYIQGFGGETQGKEITWTTQTKWEDNIKMDFQEVGCRGMDWIDLAQGRDRWQALVNAEMNLQVPLYAENSLTSCKLVSF
jgi:hypothetical protein